MCVCVCVCFFQFACLTFSISVLLLLCHSLLPTKMGVLLGEYLGAFNFMAKFKGHGKRANNFHHQRNSEPTSGPDGQITERCLRKQNSVTGNDVYLQMT